MAQAVYEQAIDADGGLFYEAEHGSIINTDKHWWPQSEAVVGFLNAWQLTGRPHFLMAAERSWISSTSTSSIIATANGSGASRAKAFPIPTKTKWDHGSAPITTAAHALK